MAQLASNCHSATWGDYALSNMLTGALKPLAICNCPFYSFPHAMLLAFSLT